MLYMLDQAALARVLLPVGDLTKAEVRAAGRRGSGLRTAAKPDSQDVCFITATGGRRAFLGDAHRAAPGPGGRRRRPRGRRGRRGRAGHRRPAARPRAWPASDAARYAVDGRRGRGRP